MNNIHPAMMHTIRVNYLQMAVRQQDPSAIAIVLRCDQVVRSLEAAGRYDGFKIIGIDLSVSFDEMTFETANQMVDVNPLFINK